MYKRVISLGIILVLIFFILYNYNNETASLKNGTYVLEQSVKETVLSPRITISGDEIIFSYDSLSSYLPIGVYKIEEDLLTMTTNDKKYKYVFEIDGDKLIFMKNESSKVNLIDERFGIKIKNNAEFKLIEN
jgi:hypothetical protein